MTRKILSLGLAFALALSITGCDEKKSSRPSAQAPRTGAPAAVTPLKLTASVQNITPVSTGAEPGVWTTDLAAAKKAAASKDLPILLFFTGSDWCKYCKKLTEDVLSKEAWKTWTAKNLFLVYVDFPQNPEKLPKQLMQQNQQLQKEFEIQSFPTLILLDAQANFINSIPVEQQNTPESILRPIKNFIYRCEYNIGKVVKSLPADDPLAAELKKDMAKITQARETLNKEIAAFQKKQQELGTILQDCSRALQITMTEVALRKVSPEQRKHYEETKKLYQQTQKNFQEWLKTNPQQSQDNMVTYASFLRKIQEQKNILDDIVTP